MKKIIYTSLFLGTMVVASCNNERVAVNSLETMKTQEMKNFDTALKSLMNPENRSTPEEKERLGMQLNERSLDILYSASKEMLEANGYKIVLATTRFEKEQVISKGTKLYHEKLRDIDSQLKSEN